MKHSYFAAALVSSGLLIAPGAFAQQPSPSTASPGATQSTQNSSGANRQPTEGSDPTSQYNFSTPGGQYSERATKQRTDGEDVTGNNNFPAASK
jgi:hypothetical protein